MPSPLERFATQVWLVPLLSEAASHSVSSWLSPDEMSRANRFVTPQLRRRFILCRGSLRHLLGKQTGQSPASLRFHYQQWGKPQLTNPGSPPLHFNVSHSGDWAAIAIAYSPLGVDIEIPSRPINLKAIATQVLSESEAQSWKQIPPALRDQTLLRLWVCKEALLKAMGLGIVEGLKKTTFPIPFANQTSLDQRPLAASISESQAEILHLSLESRPAFRPLGIDPTLQIHLEEDGTCRMNSWLDPEHWQVRFLEGPTACTAALATSREVTQIEIAHLDPDKL